ncbi:type IV pilin [Natrinema longum]|uniref:Type IV pilin N-terminal domain-containing protein n=1 Tax=Natrinema longum TaxID=370324 RepID=A0A8A2UD13_9EURY|nr:type IV pilin N-terminal domain-containing protein [Natrinema longum]MBZ6495968.1 type IV pilin N-terminal domain-containing protein [Natrinema longum]QSW86095.1 type IV pilin N-terminal domain-containing protein [Natrinema longum]
MDLIQYRAKLIGNDEQRAVSPVIGVILMVAITVILAAVIAAFVLDLGGSVGQEAQAGVSIDVNEETDRITVEVTSLGNSDHVNVTGDLRDTSDSSAGSGTYAETWDGTNGVKDSMSELEVGDTVTFGPTSSADVQMGSSANPGTATVVAVIESDETVTQVASKDYDLDW